MSLPVSLTYSDAGTTAVDKINAGIQYLSTLQGEIDTALGYITTLEGQVTRLLQITASLGQIGQDLTTVESEITTLQAQASELPTILSYITTIEGEITTLQARAETAAQASDVAASLSGLLRDTRTAIAAFQISLPLLGRPGCMPTAFTTDLASGISGVPSSAQAVITSAGTVLRVAGAFVLAAAALQPIEPDRTYKVRAVMQRNVDTADPAGDAVSFQIAWYGADRNLLALPSSDVATQPLTVAMGRTTYVALLSPAPALSVGGVAAPALQPPAGAAYCRPFVQVYGDTPVTDVEILTVADVSDLINLLA